MSKDTFKKQYDRLLSAKPDDFVTIEDPRAGDVERHLHKIGGLVTVVPMASMKKILGYMDVPRTNYNASYASARSVAGVKVKDEGWIVSNTPHHLYGVKHEVRQEFAAIGLNSALLRRAVKDTSADWLSIFSGNSDNTSKCLLKFDEWVFKSKPDYEPSYHIDSIRSVLSREKAGDVLLSKHQVGLLLTKMKEATKWFPKTSLVTLGIRDEFLRVTMTPEKSIVVPVQNMGRVKQEATTTLKDLIKSLTTLGRKEIVVQLPWFTMGPITFRSGVEIVVFTQKY